MTTAYFFQIGPDGRVTGDIPQEAFRYFYLRFTKLNVTIYGKENTSLISLDGVADFFDVDAGRDYQWMFLADPTLPADRLVAKVET